MSRRRKPARDVNAALDALYAELPTIECKGKCWDSCGPIAMTEPERRRIQQRHGVTIPDRTVADRGLCSALTMLNRCRVWIDRPSICRAFGVTDGLPCNYGCVPEGGRWSNRRFYLWLARVHDLAGEHAEARFIRDRWEDDAVAAQSEAQFRAFMDGQDLARQLQQRRAEKAGTAVYVTGPGRITNQRTEQCS